MRFPRRLRLPATLALAAALALPARGGAQVSVSFVDVVGDPPALLDDLFNGVVFFNGQRYAITPLDLAILADAETIRPAAVVPEPSTVALLATVGLPGLVLAARRRR